MAEFKNNRFSDDDDDTRQAWAEGAPRASRNARCKI